MTLGRKEILLFLHVITVSMIDAGCALVLFERLLDTRNSIPPILTSRANNLVAHSNIGTAKHGGLESTPQILHDLAWVAVTRNKGRRIMNPNGKVGRNQFLIKGPIGIFNVPPRVYCARRRRKRIRNAEGEVQRKMIGKPSPNRQLLAW